MTEHKLRNRLNTIDLDGALGPTGFPLTRDDLPDPNTKRWVSRRKAEVVAGVRAGLISLNEACRRYNLSIDEFLSWQRLFDKHGLAGLRSTQIKKYRARPSRWPTGAKAPRRA